MTPRERMRKAMNLETPDRVPLMCQFSIGFINQQLKSSDISPMQLWLDAQKYADALIRLRETFAFDGILVSLHGHDPQWREKIVQLEIVDGIEKATFANRTETYVDDDLPMGQIFDSGERDIDSVDPGDIPATLNYIPVSKNCYFHIHPAEPHRVFDILDARLAGEYSIHGEITSPFDYLLDYLGYENALMALMLDPDKTQQILDKFTLGVIKMAKGLAAHSAVDAIKISSPFVGMGFISPEQYREFELPYLTRIAAAIKNAGAFAYVHTCGHINDRLEIMAEAGLSGLECLDPPPIGNVELADAFTRIGGKMFIKGNIDSVNTLLNGTPQSIEIDVANRLRIGMQHSGFILSTACSIAPKVPAEHIRLLSKIVNQRGKYRKGK